MIGLFSKEKYIPTNNINIKNLDFIIGRIKNNNDKLCRYVTELYFEYYSIIHESNIENIEIELKKHYKNDIIEINDDVEKIENCNLIISPSHSDTYFVLKQLIKNRKENVLVICFDMHSDTYDYNDKLWKGNVFSKLIKEKIINNFIVLGVPNNKIKNTFNDIPCDIRNNVKIKKIFGIKNDIKKFKPTTIFISVDIDCLDTRKNKYSALEYCPMTILSNLSKVDINDKTDEEIVMLVKNCIFVKNDLGYSNLYRVGENKLNIKKLIKKIKQIKKYCLKNKVNLGFNDKKIYADISEVNGYDYNKKTLEVISKLIDELI